MLQSRLLLDEFRRRVGGLATIRIAGLEYQRLYSFFESWCGQAIQAGDMNDHEVELVLGMSQMWGAYVGDRVELQSLKYFYLEDCIEGGRHIDWLLVV